MDTCNKCEVVTTYKAPDGKVFDTPEECRAYVEQPTLYLIEQSYNGRTINIYDEGYLDYTDAQAVISAENNDIYSRFTYRIITIKIKVPEKPTVQTAITNTPSKYIRLWDKLVNYLKG